MSLRHLRHCLAWFFGVVALTGYLLSPVVQSVAQAHVDDPAPRTDFRALSSVEVHDRIRQLLHMTPAEIRLLLTAHNSGTKHLCELTASLAKATANALPTGFVALRFLTIATSLPRVGGVPLAAHNVEGLHPRATGPPAQAVLP